MRLLVQLERSLVHVGRLGVAVNGIAHLFERRCAERTASLGKIGINVKLEKLANATMRDRVGKGDYDIAIGNWSPDFADPYMFMNYWFESDKKGLPGNRSFYENKEVDSLLQAALKTTDQAERTKDYQQAQKVVIDEAAYVYLFQKNYQLAMNKEVKGFTFNPMLEQVFNIATMSK